MLHSLKHKIFRPQIRRKIPLKAGRLVHNHHAAMPDLAPVGQRGAGPIIVLPIMVRLQNAGIPVIARPRISAWTSCVPS